MTTSSAPLEHLVEGNMIRPECKKHSHVMMSLTEWYELTPWGQIRRLAWAVLTRKHLIQMELVPNGLSITSTSLEKMATAAGFDSLDAAIEQFVKEDKEEKAKKGRKKVGHHRGAGVEVRGNTAIIGPFEAGPIDPSELPEEVRKGLEQLIEKAFRDVEEMGEEDTHRHTGHEFPDEPDPQLADILRQFQHDHAEDLADDDEDGEEE